jgi:hypothetical protein
VLWVDVALLIASVVLVLVPLPMGILLALLWEFLALLMALLLG